MEDEQDVNSDADANKRARTDAGSGSYEVSTDDIKATQMVRYSLKLPVVSVPAQVAVVENTILLYNIFYLSV